MFDLYSMLWRHVLACMPCCNTCRDALGSDPLGFFLDTTDFIVATR